MLEQFRKAQEPAVNRLLAAEARGGLPLPYLGKRPPFAARLRAGGPGTVIAEYKRASPSQGAINLALGPEEVAAAYAKAGAGALSVLTEQRHFKGKLAFLQSMRQPGLPLLRKDFLIHPVQVAETASTPASALLLIVRMLDSAALAAMLVEAGRFGLEAVLEVFNRDDLERARQGIATTGTSPAIVQVNSRDLDTLTVNEAPTRALIAEKRPGEIWIAASGIRSRAQVLERAALGFDAVLVGGFPMSCRDPGAAMAELTGQGNREKRI